MFNPKAYILIIFSRKIFCTTLMLSMFCLDINLSSKLAMANELNSNLSINPVQFSDANSIDNHGLNLSDIDEHEADEEINDSFEKINRVIFAFNDTLDIMFLKPIAQLYGFVLPQWGRDRISSFLINLHEPVYFINHLLQGNSVDAISTLNRFLINSTMGGLGILDFASEAGFELRASDFGLTLKKYGIANGPYLILPLLGPSSLRDTPAMLVDLAIDPWGYYKFKNFNHHQSKYNTFIIARYSLELIDKRQRHIKVIKDIENTSLDKYLTIRSIYMQKR